MSVSTPDLIPKNELERAYIQARYWNSLHSWRKGTRDLISGNIGIATGKYLAMVRIQLLDGFDDHAAATLESIWELNQRFSQTEKLSIVRIICRILEEVQEQVEPTLAKERLRSRLIKMATALAAQLKDDRIAQVEALSLIRQTADEDLLAGVAVKLQSGRLEKFIESCKPKLREIAIAGIRNKFQKPEMSMESKIILTAIFDQASSFPMDINILFQLAKFTSYLISQNQVKEASFACAKIRKYCTDLSKQETHLHCSDSISQLYEKVLHNADALSLMDLRSVSDAPDLQTYGRSIAHKHVAALAFEEHYFSWSSRLKTSTSRENIEKLTQADLPPYGTSLNLLIAHTLNYLADNFLHIDYLNEARACSLLAILERIRCMSIHQREIEDLCIMAVEALKSKQYQTIFEMLLEVKNTLEFSTYESVWFQRFSTLTDLLHHLFQTLISPTEKLDSESFSVLSYIMILYSKIVRAPQTNECAELILELLCTRIDKSSAPEVLKLYWQDVPRLRAESIFQKFVHSLLDLTEANVDKVLANEFILDFMRSSSLNSMSQSVIPLLNQLVQNRKNEDSNDPSVVPIQAVLARLSMKGRVFDECQSLCNKILEVGNADASFIPQNSTLKVQCIEIFFELEKDLLLFRKNETVLGFAGHSELLASKIHDLISSESNTAPCLRDFSFMLCDFLGETFREQIAIPNPLKKTIEFIDVQTLHASVAQLDGKYSQGVIAALMSEIVQVKSAHNKPES